MEKEEKCSFVSKLIIIHITVVVAKQVQYFYWLVCIIELLSNFFLH